MVNKAMKIFKVIILCELLILAGVFVIKHYDAKTADATYWLAHNSSAPTSFKVTVQNIYLTKVDGTQVNIWSGSEEVDLATVTSLGDVKAFKGDIPAGIYKKFSLTISSNYKVKGSVTLDGKTYYTKASGTGFETGPAEEQAVRIMGQDKDQQAIERTFDPVLTLGTTTSISEIHVLVDTANFLTYYDGNETTSNGLNFGSYKPTAGMYLWNYLPYGLVVGKPGKKEVYEYTSSHTQTTGTGLLTIVYDGDDNPIDALSRPLYTNSSGTSFKLCASSAGVIFGSNLKKNADGTIRIQMNPAPTDTDTSQGFGTIVLTNFQRASHSGAFTSDRQGTGTYTATKIQ
jgi:hypothetical protein